MGSFFGKLFAPSRWSSSAVNKTRLKRVALADTQLDADAATIPVVKTAGFDAMDAAGTVYMGGEAISYAAKSTQATTTTDGYPSETLGTFTGCTRGLYPAFTEPRGTGTETWGKTFEYPRSPEMSAGDVGAHQPVADEPFSFVGRHVGLYVTTYDFDTGAWNSVDDAQLVWAGRIAESITFDPSRGVWTLECSHILGDLERKLCAHLPEVSGFGINLNGGMGRTFVAVVYIYRADLEEWKCVGYRVCEIAAGYYTASGVSLAVQAELNGDWTDTGDGTSWSDDYTMYWSVQRVDGKVTISLDQGDTPLTNARFVIYSSVAAGTDSSLAYDAAGKTAQSGENPCHALQALGFSTTHPIVFEVDDMGCSSVTGENEGSIVYQPLHHNFNASVMLANRHGTDNPWLTQGDYEAAGGTAWACLATDGATNRGAKDQKHVIAYTAMAFDSVAVNGLGTAPYFQFVLANSLHQPMGYPSRDAFVGSPDGVIWKQCWQPKVLDANGARIGPIRQLLPELLSTGTAEYNDADYDNCPPALSCCIPSALIDKASFLRADAQIRAAYPASSLRWTLVEEPTSWLDLFLREARAYGYAVVWDASQGKIACRPVFDIDQQTMTVSLDESNTAAPDDFPAISMSVGTVINQWSCEVGHNLQTDKPQQIVVNDRESIEGLDGIVKEIKLKHPGIRTNRANTPAVTAELFKALMQSSSICRYALHRIRRSLDATLMGQVSVGDLVSVTYTAGYQDPAGTGDRTLSGTALVLDVAWNYEQGAGSCDLLILPEGASPWAPSALVDITAANAGWAVGTKTLTLVANGFGEATDSHDGAAFAVDGYKIVLVPRAPADPTTVTPIAATVASYTTGTRALVIDEDISVSFDTTGETEYVVLFADWATATAAQQATGTWQAGTTTHVLGTDDEAQVYG